MVSASWLVHGCETTACDVDPSLSMWRRQFCMCSWKISRISSIWTSRWVGMAFLHSWGWVMWKNSAGAFGQDICLYLLLGLLPLLQLIIHRNPKVFGTQPLVIESFQWQLRFNHRSHWWESSEIRWKTSSIPKCQSFALLSRSWTPHPPRQPDSLASLRFGYFRCVREAALQGFAVVAPFRSIQLPGVVRFVWGGVEFLGWEPLARLQVISMSQYVRSWQRFCYVAPSASNEDAAFERIIFCSWAVGAIFVSALLMLTHPWIHKDQNFLLSGWKLESWGNLLQKSTGPVVRWFRMGVQDLQDDLQDPAGWDL